MVEIRDEIEHNIWWQIKAGEASFWFDNWTKQGALYYTEEQGGMEEEIEVKQFIRNEEWDQQMLNQRLSREMVEYVMNSISPRISEEERDIPWWMGSTSGNFTVQSAFELMRRKKEKVEWRKDLWGKEIPFKCSFLVWRCWRGRIATEDILKRMKINIASRCYCCDKYEEETIKHLFLTAPIAQKLWREFASCAGVQIQEGLQQMIKVWWEISNPIKLRIILRAIPAIIMWELWKRRNTRKYGKDINFYKLKQQCLHTIIQLIKMKYPWINVPKEWSEIVILLKGYKPKLHCYAVKWIKPQNGIIKCNMDGASRGNPGKSAYSFCLRDDKGDILYAKSEEIGHKTNMEAETIAILQALRYCKGRNMNKMILETNSLILTKMIRTEWKIPWQQIEEIEEIRELIRTTQSEIHHIFRKANLLADKLANEACDQQRRIQVHTFQQLSSECKRIVNTDKAQIPTLRIRTRKIIVDRQQNAQR